MAYSAADFLQDLTGIAQRVGASQSTLDDPQQLACFIAYKLGLQAGKQSLQETSQRRAVQVTHEIMGRLASPEVNPLNVIVSPEFKQACELLEVALREMSNDQTTGE